MKDVSLSPELERIIGKQAEAEREKEWLLLIPKVNWPFQKIFQKQLQCVLKLQERFNQLTIYPSDQSNTIVYMLPAEVFYALEGLTKQNK